MQDVFHHNCVNIFFIILFYILCSPLAKKVAGHLKSEEIRIIFLFLEYNKSEPIFVVKPVKNPI